MRLFLLRNYRRQESFYRDYDDSAAAAPVVFQRNDNRTENAGKLVEINKLMGDVSGAWTLVELRHDIENDP